MDVCPVILSSVKIGMRGLKKDVNGRRAGVHWQVPKHTNVYTECPKKVERSISVTLIFENIAFFHQITHCLLKRMIPRSLTLFELF